MKSVLSLILPLTYFACGLTAAHHASRPQAPEGFVPMFDGKTMSGWYADPAGPQTVWNIDEKSGEIRRSLKHGYLWSEQSYGNFILELEYKLSKGLEIWKYELSKMKADASSYIPLYGLLAGSSSGMKKELTILFDDNSVVKKYNMSDSPLKVRTGIFNQ